MIGDARAPGSEPATEVELLFEVGAFRASDRDRAGVNDGGRMAMNRKIFIAAGFLIAIQPRVASAQPAAPPAPEPSEEQAWFGHEWVWVNAEVGVIGGKVGCFDTTEGCAGGSGAGVLVGAGLGLRLLFMTVGPVFRTGTVGDGQLTTIGPEIGFHFPEGRRYEFHAGLGASFAHYTPPGESEIDPVYTRPNFDPVIGFAPRARRLRYRGHALALSRAQRHR